MNEALWALGRGTGVVALVMFTATLVLGIVSRSGRPVPGLGRFGLNELHRTAALTGVGADRRTPRVPVLRPLRPAHAWSTSCCRSWAPTGRCCWASGRSRSTCWLVVTVVSLLRNVLGPRVFAPCTGSPTPCGRSPWCTLSAPAPTPTSSGWTRSPPPAWLLSPRRSPGGCLRRTPSAAARASPGSSPDERDLLTDAHGRHRRGCSDRRPDLPLPRLTPGQLIALVEERRASPAAGAPASRRLGS